MNNPQEISDSDGEYLVKMARKTVTALLRNESRTEDSEFNSRFDFNSGIFVTINKQSSLRGCIGFPLPIKKLSEGLVDAATAAAIEDYRFSPVTKDELDKIVFEVTVLTPPIEINVKDTKEYLSAIKIGRDGLIVENSYSSGLLLPQVPVEYGWNVEEFLNYTCEKAGLDRDVWRDKSTKISRFEGIVFKEELPNGPIIRESLE